MRKINLFFATLFFCSFMYGQQNINVEINTQSTEVRGVVTRDIVTESARGRVGAIFDRCGFEFVNRNSFQVYVEAELWRRWGYETSLVSTRNFTLDAGQRHVWNNNIPCYRISNYSVRYRAFRLR